MSTACTPGSASASDVSMERMRACGYGLRTRLACRRPGIATSSVYGSVPLTTRSLAGACSDVPTRPVWARSAARVPSAVAADPAAAVADPVARTGPSPSGRSPPQPAECAWAAPPCSPRIASSMARYPVHRQRLLFITRGRSSRSPSPSDAAVTTMPGVQNPHWNPAASTNRSCTGCRSPGVPSPAAVVTSRPAARNAGRMHECTASPSRSTEHAPQSPESQPFFTLNTSCARSHVRRLWPGAGSPGISRPSTVMLTGVLLPSSWWRRPAGCRARRRAVRRRSPPPRRPAPRGSPPRAARSRHGASRRRRARR